MRRLRICLLGYFKVELDGQNITTAFRTEKEKALLAYLVMESTRPVKREILGELLWPERSIDKSRTNLRQALYGIRKILDDQHQDPPFFIVVDDTIQFNQECDYFLDTEYFAASVESTASHLHGYLSTCDSCLDDIQEAVDLYRGDFFADLYQIDSIQFMEWLYSHRERYQRLMLTALKTTGGIYEARRDFTTAIQFARRNVRIDPLDESSQRYLMQLLYKSGDRCAALEQYQACRRLLAEELKAAPSQDTKDLYKRIRDGTLQMEQKRAEPDHCIPPELTSFFGREVELASLSLYFHDPVGRLLAFVGMPGSGKTRLAVRTAHEYKDLFDDGVYFIPLADDTPLLPALAGACGFSNKLTNDTKPQLLHYFSSLNLLLILDNFCPEEHEIDLLIDILRSAPEVKILVTSQERVKYQTAYTLEIQDLEYPQENPTHEAIQYPAVQLFLSRAVYNHSGFVPSELNIFHAVRICQLVDGNPLAIELAASNVNRFSVEQIADSLEDSLDVLATDKQDIPLRHRTMLNAIDDVWNKLSDKEAEVARTFSSLDAAIKLDDLKYFPGLIESELISLFDRLIIFRNENDEFQMSLLYKTYIKGKNIQDRELQVIFHDKITEHEMIAGGHAPAAIERAIFWNRLEYLIHQAQRHRSMFGVILLELIGDKKWKAEDNGSRETMITTVAGTIRDSLRKTDMIVRLKANEFVLLVADLMDRSALEIVIDKLILLLSDSMEGDQQHVKMSFRIGSSFYPEDGDAPISLLRKAREARDQLSSYPILIL